MGTVLRPMSAIGDESPDVINLNDLPPLIVSALANGRKEFLQDSANSILPSRMTFLFSSELAGTRYT